MAAPACKCSALPFSDLITRDLTKLAGPRFELTQDLTFQSPSLGLIVVPTGFVTDFASIPRFLWPVLPPVGPYDKAAVVHDWLYCSGQAGAVKIDRAASDRALKEGMIALAIPTRIIWTIYTGVRLGGKGPWNAYRAGTGRTK